MKTIYTLTEETQIFVPYLENTSTSVIKSFATKSEAIAFADDYFDKMSYQRNAFFKRKEDYTMQDKYANYQLKITANQLN